MGVVLALAALAAAPSPAAGAHARLAVIAAHPVTVRGTGFAARERVRIVLRSPPDRVVRVARADESGRVTVAFAHVALDRCSTSSIVATGAQGSRATWRRRPLPACAPA